MNYLQHEEYIGEESLSVKLRLLEFIALNFQLSVLAQYVTI